MNTKDTVEELIEKSWFVNKEGKRLYALSEGQINQALTKAHAEGVAEVLQECLDSANVAQDIHQLTAWIKEDLQLIKKDK